MAKSVYLASGQRQAGSVRVNKIYHRIEFFNVSLSDLKEFVHESLPDAEFIENRAASGATLATG